MSNEIKNTPPLSKKATAWFLIGTFAFVGLIIFWVILRAVSTEEVNKDKYQKVEQNKSVDQNNPNTKVNQQDSRKEQENSNWDKKQKEKEDEVKRQYNSPEMQKSREEDLKKQKEADQKELDNLKKRYLDK